MSTTLNQRSPVAKAGWLIGLFLMGWLAFVFVPWPWRTPSLEPVPKLIVRPPSKLRAVGLVDNPDWGGLPELFAIWADHAGWKDDKAQFAYWNPGTQSYSYFFEAIRKNKEVRFRPIPEPDFLAQDPLHPQEMLRVYYYGSDAEMVAETDLKTESLEHPFVFFQPIVWQKTGPYFEPLNPKRISPDKPRVKVDVRPAPLDVAKPERKVSTPDSR